MPTKIEARRLNGTDLSKTISFSGTVGELRAVTHGRHTDAGRPGVRYVSVVVNLEVHVLAPGDMVTLTGRKPNG